MVVVFPTRSHSSQLFLFFLASSSFFFLVSASLIIFNSCCSSLSFLLIASSSLLLASLIFLRSCAVGMFWLSLCVLMWLNIFLFWIVSFSLCRLYSCNCMRELRLWEQGRLVPDYFVIDVRAWLLFSVATSTVVYNNLSIFNIHVLCQWSNFLSSEPGCGQFQMIRRHSLTCVRTQACENPAEKTGLLIVVK